MVVEWGGGGGDAYKSRWFLTMRGDVLGLVLVPLVHQQGLVVVVKPSYCVNYDLGIVNFFALIVLPHVTFQPRPSLY